MYLRFKIVVFLLIQCVGLHFCLLQVIFERALMVYQNEKYTINASISVRRNGRRNPYILNIEGITRQTWANNVTINLLFKEFLHNEYRPSFIDLKFKFCNLVGGSVYIGKMLASAGLYCPLPQGEYHFKNMTVPTDTFPNVFPFERGRVDIHGTSTDTGDTMFQAYVYCTFINKLKKRDKI